MIVSLHLRIEVLAKFAVFRRVGRRIVGEINFILNEVGRVIAIHFVDQIDRRNAAFFSLDHDGRAVGVLTTNVVALMSTQAMKTAPNVGLYLLNQMADMDTAIGVGEC